MDQINWYYFWGTLVFTVLPFLWILKLKDNYMKMAYALIAVFIWLYSGAGISLKRCNPDYAFYYFAYIIVLSIVLRFSKRLSAFSKMNSKHIENYLNRHYKAFIILYFVVLIMSLIFPVNRLYYLIHPPQIDLAAEFVRREIRTTQTLSGASQGLEFVRLLLKPFFYWALYKFVHSKWKLLLLLVVDLYLTYCVTEYLGRHVVLAMLLLFVWLVYNQINSQKRLLLIIASLTLVPFISWVFFQISLIRIGLTTENISYSVAMSELLAQEINYPLHYDEYKGFFSSGLIFEYFLWIILLPFPGFMKFGLGNLEINKLFTFHISGMELGDQAFSISLPGLVGEAIFVFGPLFFIHAILFGLTIYFVLSFLRTDKSYLVLFCNTAISLAFLAARAGTGAVYSSVYKLLLYFLIFIWFITKRKRV